MSKGTVEKVTWFSQWEFNGKTNHNFVVKFKGSDDRFVYVGGDKDNPKFKEGSEMEYKLDGRKIKGAISGHNFEYEKISPVQQQGGGFGGGGGGNRNFVKSKEQYANEIVGYIGGYAKDLLAHRINLGKDSAEIVKEYGVLVDGMYSALVKHIK